LIQSDQPRSEDDQNEQQSGFESGRETNSSYSISKGSTISDDDTNDTEMDVDVDSSPNEDRMRFSQSP